MFPPSGLDPIPAASFSPVPLRVRSPRFQNGAGLGPVTRDGRGRFLYRLPLYPASFWLFGQPLSTGRCLPFPVDSPLGPLPVGRRLSYSRFSHNAPGLFSDEAFIVFFDGFPLRFPFRARLPRTLLNNPRRIFIRIFPRRRFLSCIARIVASLT